MVHNCPVSAHRGISKQLKIVPGPGAQLLSRVFDNTERDMQILGRQLLAVMLGPKVAGNSILSIMYAVNSDARSTVKALLFAVNRLSS